MIDTTNNSTTALCETPAATIAAPKETASGVDFDLHGVVGIRLLDASPADVKAVTRQVGPIRAPLSREPDITVRFVDRLATSSRVRYLGLDEVGFTDDAFLVLRSKHTTGIRVQIPFEQIGGRVEIVCESGVPAVPLLIPIINLTALAKGVIPLHAAAFNYQGTGVVTTGWSKGGKTETLLAFMANGAQYIGDEWIYLTRDGRRMFGIPEPVTVWDWHLRQMPQFRSSVSRGDRARLGAIGCSVRALDTAVSNSLGRRVLPTTLLGRIRRVLKRQLFVHLPPERAFGQQSSPMAGTPDKFIFVASHATPDVTIRPMDPQDIARRMVFSLQEERSDFLSHYMKFRFAFPERANDFIEQAEGLQRRLLCDALRDKDAYSVFHPYPVEIPSLFEAIRPVL